MDSRADKGPRSVQDSTQAAETCHSTPVEVEHNFVAKNVINRTSRKLAIEAMCAACMGCTADYMEPGFKNEIRNCTAPTCPLWHFRPYQ